MNSQLSAKFTLWCSRGLFIIICLLTFAMPGLLRWYQALRPLGRYGAAAIMIGFYCCVPAVLYALSCMERLVRNILKEDVFVTQNVRFLRRIRWCCAAVRAWAYITVKKVRLSAPARSFMTVCTAP